MNDLYQKLLDERARLDAQIAAVRASKRHEVMAQIAKLMSDFEISAAELNAWVAGETSGDRRRRRVEPQYWDPVTGATWSGRGKRPLWMKGRDPEEFRLPPSSHWHPGLAASDAPGRAHED